MLQFWNLELLDEEDQPMFYNLTASHLLEGFVGASRNINPVQLTFEGGWTNKGRYGCLHYWLHVHHCALRTPA